MIQAISEKEKGIFNKASLHPLQSWEWGEFRKEWGNKVIRLGVFEGRKLVDAIQVVFSKIPKTKFKIGTVIRGPIPTKEILDALKNLARQENAIFIRLEPNVLVDPKFKVKNSKLLAKNKKELIKVLRTNGCAKGKTLFTPTSFWLDLTKPEEELMQSFHPKTRYNIRLAQKRGVEVIEDNSSEAFEKYIKLTQETVKRQGFYAHSEKYHRLMWKYLHQLPIANHQSPIARLLTARYKGEIITTWILFVWHDFLYYPYGASTEKYKNTMANNLIMWEAIKYGKKLGLKTFDLWGRETGKGFTKFKEGYNPQVAEFLGTWDLVTSPLYRPYRIAEFLRWQILRVKSKFIKPVF